MGVQATALHILHDNPEIGSDQETVNVVDDVFVFRCLHNEDLVDNEVLREALSGTDITCEGRPHAKDHDAPSLAAARGSSA